MIKKSQMNKINKMSIKKSKYIIKHYSFILWLFLIVFSLLVKSYSAGIVDKEVYIGNNNNMNNNSSKDNNNTSNNDFGYNDGSSSTQIKTGLLSGIRRKKEQKKELLNVACKSKNNVIILNKKNYEKYILDEPKDIDMIVLYLTHDSKCPLCSDYESFFDQYSRLYHNDYIYSPNNDYNNENHSYDNNTHDNNLSDNDYNYHYNHNNHNIISNNTKKKLNHKNQLVFAKMLVQDQKLVEFHQLTTVPVFVYFKKGNVYQKFNKHNKNYKNYMLFDIKDQFLIFGLDLRPNPQSMPNVIMPGLFLPWLNMKSSRKLDINNNINNNENNKNNSNNRNNSPNKSSDSYKKELITLLYIITFITCIPSLVYLGVKIVNKYPILLSLISIFIYSSIISGIIFNITSNVPIYHKDPSSNTIQYIAKHSRHQYLGEGMFASMCTLFIATLLKSTTYIYNIQLIDKLINSTEIFHIKICNMFNINRNKYASILRNLTLFIFIFLLTCSLFLLFKLFAYKSPWYKPAFLPPHYFIHGSVRASRNYAF